MVLIVATVRKIQFCFYRDDSMDGLLANMSFLLHGQEEDKEKVKDNEEEEWVTESDRDDKNEFATESDRNAIEVSSTVSDTSPMMGRRLQDKYRLRQLQSKFIKKYNSVRKSWQVQFSLNDQDHNYLHRVLVDIFMWVFHHTTKAPD